MQPDKLPDPGSAEEWLRFAQGDLALARTSSSDEVPIELLLFHAEQAVEKSIKAVLILFDVRAPRTHNIEMLIDTATTVVEVPAMVREAAKLTPYATAARYPGYSELKTDEDLVDALKLAESIVSWAKHTCGKD